MPLYRTSYALMLTTGVNAALGLLFWVAAARLYPADIVGLGAAGVSALQLVAAVGWAGLHYTLVRYLPVAGKERRRLTVCVYAAGGLAAVVVAVVFTLGFTDTLRVSFVSGSTTSRAVFCACVFVWVVFSLEDAAFVGLRRSLIVPFANSLYGVLKLVPLLLLTSVASPWTLVGVWVGAAALLAVPINSLLFWTFLRDKNASRLPSTRTVVGFSAGHTAVAVAAWIPDFLVPLLVLNYVGESENAYYYAAWTITYSVRLLVLNIASALIVEAAYQEGSLRTLVRPAARLGAVVLFPSTAALIIGGGVLLQIFGPDYAAAEALLRYFAMSLVPFTVIAIAVAYERVHQRFSAALLITAAASGTVVALDLALIPAFGIDGAGIGWLVGQSAGAIIGSGVLLARRERGRRRFRGR